MIGNGNDRSEQPFEILELQKDHVESSIVYQATLLAMFGFELSQLTLILISRTVHRFVRLSQPRQAHLRQRRPSSNAQRIISIWLMSIHVTLSNSVGRERIGMSVAASCRALGMDVRDVLAVVAGLHLSSLSRVPRPCQLWCLLRTRKNSNMKRTRGSTERTKVMKACCSHSMRRLR